MSLSMFVEQTSAIHTVQSQCMLGGPNVSYIGVQTEPELEWADHRMSFY
jgi:hypothetical protein